MSFEAMRLKKKPDGSLDYAYRPLANAEVNRLLTLPGSIFELETKTELGRTLPVFKRQLPSVRDYFVDAVRRFPENEYVVYEDVRMTYRQVNEQVLRYARLLQSIGVKKGDHVGILSRNYPEWIVAFYAIHYVGAVIVAINAWLPTDQYVHCLDIAEVKVLFIDAERTAKLPDGHKGIPSFVIGAHHKANGAKVAFSTPHVDINDALSALDHSKPLVEVPITFTDKCSIYFTSGTTSLPKAVLSTQRQMSHCVLNGPTSALRAALRRKNPLPIPVTLDIVRAMPSKTVLIGIPLFHASASHSYMASCLLLGNRLVLMHKWDASRAVELAQREKANVFGGVPSMTWELCHDARFQELKKAGKIALEGLNYGGAAPNAAMASTSTGLRLTPAQGWGLTETNAYTVGGTAEDTAVRPTSCGFPAVGTEIRIADPETGATLPRNTHGEVLVRGYQVAQCYYNDPKATEAAFSADGWFRSGDIGYVDDDEFLYISDRLKDLIIRGGENIASVQVESAIYTDKRVKEAAVVPVPDTVLGEQVGALVVPWDGETITEAEVQAAVAKVLSKHCIPVCVVVTHTPLPRNATGKITKNKITEPKAEWLKRTGAKL